MALDARQSSSFTLATLTFQALASGTANFNYLGGPIDDGNATLIFGSKQVVPEPPTWAPVATCFAAIIGIYRRKRVRRAHTLLGGFAVLWFAGTLTFAVEAQTLDVTTIPAPNRGAGTNPNSCPPSFDPTNGTKAPLNDPKDVNNANDKRYYMGESKFLLTAADGSTTDVIRRRWCISQDPSDQGAGNNPRFLPNDFFSLEILTSKNNVETSQIAPGTVMCCPFVGGRNLPSGIEPATVKSLKGLCAEP
jgi:hypothetical protein